MEKILIPILLVGAGGFAGSVFRFLLSLMLQRYSLTFPYGTTGANLMGCFFIGMIAQVSDATGSLSPEMRLLLATGFCGGFTTMSSMIYELMQYIKASEWAYAALYLNATFLGCIAAYYAGTLIIKVITKTV